MKLLPKLTIMLTLVNCANVGDVPKVDTPATEAFRNIPTMTVTCLSDEGLASTETRVVTQFFRSTDNYSNCIVMWDKGEEDE